MSRKSYVSDTKWKSVDDETGMTRNYSRPLVDTPWRCDVCKSLNGSHSSTCTSR